MRAHGLLRKVSPNSCTAFYIDGLYVRDLAGLMPGTVVAVEMYADQFDAPSKFPNPVDSRCPVILFWTKLGVFGVP
ncbi:MAG: hypothetical protein M3081_13485 [Gemmatimonadota bacterium]|nr:hypothetical protein [Gemmatimonadota bacterium]